MKKNKGSAQVILLVVLLVIVVGGMAYYLGTKDPQAINNNQENMIPVNNLVDDSSNTKKDETTILPAPTPQPGLTQSIKVLSPNGGEVIQIGKPYIIKWSTTGFPATAKISLALQDNSINCSAGMVGCWSQFGINNKLVENTGSYVWDTNQKMFGDGGPNSRPVTPGNNYKIFISINSSGSTQSPDMYDSSDAPFTIVR